MPILIIVAIVTLVFGTDHPNGAWPNRNRPQHALPSDVRALGEGVLESQSARDGTKYDEDNNKGSQAGLPDEPEKSVTVDVQDVIASNTDAGRLNTRYYQLSCISR